MAKLRVSPQRRLGIDLAGSERELVRQLVAFRRLRGYSQQQVAERMGVSRTTVSQFENLNGGPTKNHTLLTVKRYAEAVNAYVDHIAVDAGAAAGNGDRSSYASLRDAVIEHRKELEDTPRATTPTPSPLVLTIISDGAFTEANARMQVQALEAESSEVVEKFYEPSLQDAATKKPVATTRADWSSPTPSQAKLVPQ